MLNTDELREQLLKLITPGMGKARLVHESGHPGDAEERHYFSTEADDEYRNMTVDQIIALTQRIAIEARNEERERIKDYVEHKARTWTLANLDVLPNGAYIRSDDLLNALQEQTQ